MYTIDKTNTFLQVRFEDDFDYSTIKQILYKKLILPEFIQKNDLWLIGKHRADLRLGDVQTIVDDFCRLCPAVSDTKKTAIVVEPGLTSAILQLLAEGLDRKLPLACRVFESQDVAEEWIGATEGRMI